MSRRPGTISPQAWAKALARLHPLESRNPIFAWLAACTLLGLNNITVKANRPATAEALRPVLALPDAKTGLTTHGITWIEIRHFPIK